MIWEQRSQYWLFFALKLHVGAHEPIFHAFREENCIDTLYIIEKSFTLGKSGKKIRVKIFVLEIKLYCKVNNLNFKISLNKLDKKKLKNKSICAWNMSSYGHSLVPNRGVKGISNNNPIPKLWASRQGQSLFWKLCRGKILRESQV